MFGFSFRLSYAATSADESDRLREELKVLRERRENEQAKMYALDAQREKVMAPLRNLIDERDELRRTMNGHSVRVSRRFQFGAS